MYSIDSLSEKCSGSLSIEGTRGEEYDLKLVFKDKNAFGGEILSWLYKRVWHVCKEICKESESPTVK